MRPVHLEIEGFTSYREKQTIDFRPLKVFAIAGPTGAGKSSLLDGITLALYGIVPRMGVQNLKEFISLGADRATVRLDFEVGGRCYRVTRVLRQSGAKAQIDEITNGLEKKLAEGKGVSEAVEGLLGLGYVAFTQSVLLPQGKFAEFLQSDASKRQKILRDLLRLNIYEDMRGKATEEARSLLTAIDADRRLLEEHFVSATPENLRQKETVLDGVLSQKEQAVTNAETRRREHLKLAELWKLWQERAEHRSALDSLAVQEESFQDLRTSIARAKAANLLLPCLIQQQERSKAVEAAMAGHQDAKESLIEEQKALDEAKRTLEKEERNLTTIPSDRDRIEKLNAIIPLVDELGRAESRQNGLQQEITRCEHAIHTHEARVSSFEASINEAKVKLETLGSRRRELGYDVTVHELLRRAQLPASSLGEARQRLAEFEASERTALASLQAMDKSHQAAVAEESTAQRNLEKLTQEAAAAKNALAAAETEERAAAIRLTLVAGCLCPVCEQVVGELPSADTPPSLVEARARSEQAEAARDAASTRSSQARTARLRAEGKLESERTRHADLVQQRDAATSRCERALADLQLALAALGPADNEDLVSFAQNALTRVDGLERLYKNVEADEAKVLQASIKAEQDLAVERTNLSVKGELADKLKADFAELTKHIEVLRVSVTAANSADPAKEIQALKDKIGRLEEQHRQAKELVSKRELSFQAAQQRLDKAETTLTHAKDELMKAETNAAEQLCKSEFANGAEVRANARPAAVLQADESCVAQFDGKRGRLRAFIEDLDSRLIGVDLTEAVIAESQRTCAEADELAAQLTQQAVELKGQVDRLTADTKKAESMRAQQKTRSARHELVDRLARDLKSDAFQKYILEGSFRRLVAGASQRLRELNERYEVVLTPNNEKFAVIDHDHGSQTRLAETLSGGETFLVSLALALELSEQVQQAAGAVRLDSLFIDEGFGTLSPDALEVVAEAIENLGRTSRMVGVITHVPELHQRLPRLAVRPTASGSVVEFQE